MISLIIVCLLSYWINNSKVFENGYNANISSLAALMFLMAIDSLLNFLITLGMPMGDFFEEHEISPDLITETLVRGAKFWIILEICQLSTYLLYNRTHVHACISTSNYS